MSSKNIPGNLFIFACTYYVGVEYFKVMKIYCVIDNINILFIIYKEKKFIAHILEILILLGITESIYIKNYHV